MKDERGFTIIEMLIVLALLAVVALFLYSFLGQGFRLYTAQAESADEQRNMRQALSDITNKARLTDPAAITYDLNILQIGTSSYTFEDQKIKRNGTVIARDIASFEVSINVITLEIDTVKILEIDIVNTSGKSLSTSISLFG